MIKIRDLSKYYNNNGIIATGISRVNLDFEMGEFVAILGESGSGKSTLLNVLGGYDTYEDGELYIDGKETSHFNDADYGEYRRKYVVNIFQDFNLINSYTVYQNIELILLLNGANKSKIKGRVNEIIEKVGLSSHRNTKASKLSGGQKQRVAIARALAKDAPVIIADEPTGNLDSQSANEIVTLLKEISKDKLVIIVTHNFEQIEEHVTRIIRFSDGQVMEDKRVRAPEDVEKIKPVKVKDISVANKLRLARRNAFNIPIKFILLLFIFLFIVASFFVETSTYKASTEATELSHYNHNLTNPNPLNIIAKKNDGSAITNEEYEELGEISKVTEVKNYTLYDAYLFSEVTNGGRTYYVDGVAVNRDDERGSLVQGRLPKEGAEDELVLVLNKGYYSSEEPSYYEELMKQEIIFPLPLIDGKEYKIVGIKTVEEIEPSEVNSAYHVSAIEVPDTMLTDLYYSQILDDQEGNLPMKVSFTDVNLNASDVEFKVDETVESGTVKLSENFDPMTEKTINNGDFNIKLTTIYNSINHKFTVDGFEKAEDEEGLPIIYINPSDYAELIEIGNYQAYITVEHSTDIEEVVKSIEALGYDAVPVVDTLASQGFVEIMNIVFFLFTIGLFIVLLVVGALVIGIVLKSRIIYFNILRMLGATQKISRQLVIIELIFISLMAYGLFAGTLILNTYDIINISALDNMVKYYMPIDYLSNFVIIMVLTLLIGLIFARKLFKKSTIKIMGEEK